MVSENRILRELAFGKPFAITIFAVGALLWIPSVAFYTQSQKIGGTIVRTIEKDSISFPVFTFTDLSGNEHTVETHSGSNPPVYSLGQSVVIRYISTEPSSARIDDFWSLWGIPIITQLSALMLYSASWIVGRLLTKR